jgi:hypothetical protein
MKGKSVLVIYQHLPRVHRKLFLYRTFDTLVQEAGSPIPPAISDNQIAFIVVTTNKKQQKEGRADPCALLFRPSGLGIPSRAAATL